MGRWLRVYTHSKVVARFAHDGEWVASGEGSDERHAAVAAIDRLLYLDQRPAPVLLSFQTLWSATVRDSRDVTLAVTENEASEEAAVYEALYKANQS